MLEVLGNVGDRTDPLSLGPHTKAVVSQLEDAIANGTLREVAVLTLVCCAEPNGLSHLDICRMDEMYKSRTSHEGTAKRRCQIAAAITSSPELGYVDHAEDVVSVAGVRFGNIGDKFHHITKTEVRPDHPHVGHRPLPPADLNERILERRWRRMEQDSRYGRFPNWLPYVACPAC